MECDVTTQDVVATPADDKTVGAVAYGGRCRDSRIVRVAVQPKTVDLVALKEVV
jgi:hypothetical protein